MILLFNFASVAVAIILALLLLIFSGALIRLLLAKEATVKDCGCNNNKITLPKYALGRNVILLLMTVGVIVVSNYNEVGYSLVLLVAQALVLLGISAYVLLNGAWLQHFSSKVRKWRFKALANSVNVKEQSGSNIRSRRNFLKVIGVISIGVTALSSLESISTAQAGEGCGCHPSGRYFSTNPNCDCCYPNYPSTCIGSANRWEIWVCEDERYECDTVPAGTGPYLCYCPQP